MAQAHLAPDQKHMMMKARAWLGGNVEVSDTREGGKERMGLSMVSLRTTFTTEVPNVVWRLPNTTTGSRGALVSTGLTRTRIGGARLAKVGMRRGGKKVASSLALSVINRFRYMLHQPKV